MYPVNPNAPVVQSVLAYRSVLDVPGPVDLAVLVVPAPAVAQAARECASKAVRALVVISAGFAETGPEGAERQRELLTVCRQAGMRLIGPHCLPGAPKAYVAALEDVLLRVSAMVEAHPEIAELDCNPVTVLPDGAVVVDARVLVRDHA